MAFQWLEAPSLVASPLVRHEFLRILPEKFPAARARKAPVEPVL
jgi:hypothetical protein